VKNNRACECVSWNEEYGLLIQEYRTVNVNYFSEAPNETVEKTLVRKMFKKSPTTGSKIVKMLCGTPKTRCFLGFLSHFPRIIFGK
jgi:hypothetical protein